MLASRQRAAGQGGKAGTVKFRLSPLPPFRLDLTAWTLRRQAENAVDRWDGSIFRRILLLGGAPSKVAVVQVAPPESPVLQVSVTGATATAGVKPAVAPILERMFGLHVDLNDFYRFAAGDSRLAPLAERFRGMRPPRFPTVFEASSTASPASRCRCPWASCCSAG